MKDKDQASPVRLDELVHLGLIEFEDGKWRLTDMMEQVCDHFNEDYGDVSPEYVMGNRRDLVNLIDQYRSIMENEVDEEVCQDRLDDCYRKINKLLFTSIRNVTKAMDRIFETVDETYSTEANFYTKKQILEQCDEDYYRMEAEVVGNRAEKRFECLHQFLTDVLPVDDRLETLSHLFVTRLNSIWNEKSFRIRSKLREYLGKVNRINGSIRKIEKMYGLWKSSQLRAYTDLYSGHDRFFRPDMTCSRNLRLSFDYDLVPEHSTLVRIASGIANVEEGRIGKKSSRTKKQSVSAPRVQEVSTSMRDDLVDPMFEEYRSAAPGTELSSFVMGFDRYPDGMDFITKYSLFLEICVVHGPELEFRRDSDNRPCLEEYSDDECGYKIFCRDVYLRV